MVDGLYYEQRWFSYAGVFFRLTWVATGLRFLPIKASSFFSGDVKKGTWVPLTSS